VQKDFCKILHERHWRMSIPMGGGDLQVTRGWRALAGAYRLEPLDGRI
jgi:hypothetical protein